MSNTATSTETSAYVGTVADLYAAFGRGDVLYMLDRMSDDISWEEGLRVTDLPWFQRRQGKQQVAEFFPAVAEGVTLSTFEPQMLTGDGATVVAVLRIAGSLNSTGKRVEEDLWVHLWTFDEDGKVASFRHIGDLAREEMAFKP
ncbi:MAG: nuclear transport factor 2 family protein [Ilumatobacteraceae bacterium]